MSDELSYEYIGDDISHGTLISFRGSVIGEDGCHYAIPYAGSFVARTNLKDESQTKYDITHITTSHQKWVGGELASNGRIYAPPHAAPGPLIINTTDPDNITVDHLNIGFGLQTRGIGLVENGDGSGRALMVSYSGGQKVYRFSYDKDGNEELLPSIEYNYPHDLDPFYKFRKENNCYDHPSDFYSRFFGCVDGGNGKFYAIPYGSAFVMVIDTTKDDEISFLTDYPLTANADYGKLGWSSMYFFIKCPQWSKYKGGVNMDGVIYAHGTHARSVLKIDTATDTVTEIPYPQELISTMTGPLSVNPFGKYKGNKSASFFSFPGADGKVYSTPWSNPYQISIDPKDDSIEFWNIQEVLDKEVSGTTQAWYTDGTLHNNDAYLSPGEGDYVLKMSFKEEVTNVCCDPIVCCNTPSPSIVCCDPNPTPSSVVCCNTTTLTPLSVCCTCTDNGWCIDSHYNTTPAASTCCMQETTPQPTHTCTPSSTPPSTITATPTNTPTPTISQSVEITPVIIPTPNPTPTPVVTKPKKRKTWWEILFGWIK